MAVDKNKAIINYLLQCQSIYNSPLYFNLIDAKDGSIQIITTTEDKAMSKPFIDGSVEKRYTCNLVTFKSVSDLEIVRPVGTVEYPNENVEELQDVQKLIDWIQEQELARNYPNFGAHCEVQRIDTTTDEPRYDGVNSELNPPLAMYSISLVVEYIDTSKIIYNR